MSFEIVQMFVLMSKSYFLNQCCSYWQWINHLAYTRSVVTLGYYGNYVYKTMVQIWTNVATTLESVTETRPVW